MVAPLSWATDRTAAVTVAASAAIVPRRVHHAHPLAPSLLVAWLPLLIPRMFVLFHVAAPDGIP
jgi:hypothetical protein